MNKPEKESMAAKYRDRRERFVNELLADPRMNATKAAIRAGFAPASAKVKASRLKREPKVAEAIQEAMDKRAERTQITQDYVLNTIVEVVERCKQAEAVIDKEGNPTGEYRFDANACLKGAELLGKHLKLFTDKHEIGFGSIQDLSDEQLHQLAQRLNVQVIGIAAGGTA